MQNPEKIFINLETMHMLLNEVLFFNPQKQGDACLFCGKTSRHKGDCLYLRIETFMRSYSNG